MQDYSGFQCFRFSTKQRRAYLVILGMERNRKISDFFRATGSASRKEGQGEGAEENVTVSEAAEENPFRDSDGDEEMDINENESERSESASKIENFHQSWCKRWEWLEYREGQGMFCRLCIKAAKGLDNVRVWTGKGSQVYKTSTLLRHASSKKHIDAINLHKIKVFLKSLVL